MSRAALLRGALALALVAGAGGCTMLRGRRRPGRTRASGRSSATPRPGAISSTTASITGRPRRRRTSRSRCARRARAAARRVAGRTADELAQRLAAERAEAAAGEDFVVAFYTPNSRNNDLDAPRSIWHLAVKNEAFELVSTRATVVNDDEELRALFPWIGPFDVVYRVSFPPPAGATLADAGFVLEIASALGKLELDYGALPIPTPLIQPAPPERR